MKRMPSRVIAIDWSGAKAGFKKKIWLAEATADGLEDLTDGWSREAIRDRLIQERDKDSSLIVGLDFAFSFPSWFVEEQGCTSNLDFWRHVASEGDTWLDPKKRSRYFFRKGQWGHGGRSQFRATERRLRDHGKTPETVFKLVGPTQVGPGSVRGMPILLALKEAGFNIWPFDPPKMPLVIEIYPALFYEKGVKSSLEKRLKYVKSDSRFKSELHRTKASCSDDAFDAAVSALAMIDHHRELLNLSAKRGDPSIQLEGEIWLPRNL